MAADAQGKPGDIALSPEVWQHLQPIAAGYPLAQEVVRLEAITAPPPSAPPSAPPLTEATVPGLRAYLSDSILARLDAGQSAWLAELRTVTVIFLNLPNLNHTIPLAQAQAVIHKLEDILHRHEGTINKVSVDDKGSRSAGGLWIASPGARG